MERFGTSTDGGVVVPLWPLLPQRAQFLRQYVQRQRKMGFDDLMGGNKGGGGFFNNKDDGCMPSLTYNQRLWGFGICFCLGCACSFFATLSWLPGKHSAIKNPSNFAIPYSLGNIVAICSTGFLWGPKTQCKNMFKPIRRVATIVYLFFLALTLIVCFTMKNENGVGFLVIVLVIIQALALFWYCASYIPFARTMIINCAKGCCKS